MRATAFLSPFCLHLVRGTWLEGSLDRLNIDPGILVTLGVYVLTSA